ncbi:MAG: recombinase family protein [Burkholderiales bacterium]
MIWRQSLFGLQPSLAGRKNCPAGRPDLTLLPILSIADTYSAIANALNARGILTARDGHWEATTVRRIILSTREPRKETSRIWINWMRILAEAMSLRLRWL